MRTKVFEPEGSPHDENTLTQLETCAREGDAPAAVLCADAHLGYSAPIGSAVAYRELVSPSGVGFDIACGNKAVELDLQSTGVDVEDWPRIADEIQRRISFGVGRVNDEPVDHEVLDEIRDDAPMSEVADLYDLAAAQLGTVGSGNHYVDLFRDAESGRVWIGVHFGSRGFGHKIASGFLAVAQGLRFGENYKEGPMMSPPALFESNSEAGKSYLRAMALAGRYAYAGRDLVVEKVREILGNPPVLQSVHNHHNFMWEEEHDGETCFVVRKGSTPLFPGQRGFVGASMGENAVIIEGLDTEEARESLHSAPHGAGRTMSRTQAAGKWKRHWVNNVREDATVYPSEEAALAYPGATKTRRQRVRIGGLVDYEAVTEQLRMQGIEVRGGAADEAPEAYKRLPDVLWAHEGTLAVRHTLEPLVVVMAGENTYDPYKD